MAANYLMTEEQSKLFIKHLYDGQILEGPTVKIPLLGGEASKVKATYHLGDVSIAAKPVETVVLAKHDFDLVKSKIKSQNEINYQSIAEVLALDKFSDSVQQLTNAGAVTADSLKTLSEQLEAMQAVPIDATHKMEGLMATIHADKAADSDDMVNLLIGLVEYGLREVREETGMDTSHLSNAIVERWKPLLSGAMLDKNMAEQYFALQLGLKIPEHVVEDYVQNQGR